MANKLRFMLAVIALGTMGCNPDDYIKEFPKYHACSLDTDCWFHEGECRTFIVEGREVSWCTKPCDPAAPTEEMKVECPGTYTTDGPLYDAECEPFDAEGRYTVTGSDGWCLKRYYCRQSDEKLSLDGTAEGPTVCLEQVER